MIAVAPATIIELMIQCTYGASEKPPLVSATWLRRRLVKLCVVTCTGMSEAPWSVLSRLNADEIT